MLKDLRTEVTRIKKAVKRSHNPQSRESTQDNLPEAAENEESSTNSEKAQASAIEEEEVKTEEKGTADTKTETGWPGIDWSILRTLKGTILKLPELDLTEGVSTVSVEAFKAGANSMFRCYRCKGIGRGCNLVRCEVGHLLCQNCLSSLSSSAEGSCLYFNCTCSKLLKDAFGDDNDKIGAVWGNGVRRRIGRQRALSKRDFVLKGKYLDCQ